VNIQQSVFIKNNFCNVVSTASVFLTEVLVLCIGGLLVIQGTVSLGTLLAFLFIQSRVNVSLDAIPSISSAWQQLIGLLMSYGDLQQAGIDPLIDVFDRNLNLNKRTPVSLPESRDLELIDVSFATSDLDPPLFTGLSLFVSSGKHLLIESSQQDSGRALFHLISGLIQPSSGLISLGGVDINTYPTHSLRKEIALVGSEIPFFDDSIENNIFLNRSFVVPDQLVPVCEAVGLDEFVNRYKDAYQSQLINPASYLSVSEKFQFSIARALIAQPSILILDFDVCKLDASVELSIYQFCQKHSITLISTFCRPAHQGHVDRVLFMSDLLPIS
jgi:ATP-binding cassette subfamily B protein